MKNYWNWLNSWDWDINGEYAWIVLLIKGFAWVCFAILGLELACIYYLVIFFISILLKMRNYEGQNLPNEICQFGFVLTLILLVPFYTGSWIKNSYNQCWAVILTISYILTFIGFYHSVKQKDTLFKKFCKIVTITDIVSIVLAIPLMFLGGFLYIIFTGNEPPRLVEALCYGWGLASTVFFLSKIPNMIDFNAIKINYLYSKGDKLCEQGRYKQAIEIYNKAHSLEDTNDNPYFFYAVGIANYELGEYKNAEENFYNAISKDDTYPEFYYAIADTYLQLNDYKSGLNYIEKLLNKLDKKSKKYKECEKFKIDFEKKQEGFEQERKQKQADGYYKQALNLKDSTEFGKAIKIIEKAIDLVPNNKDYENLLSELQKFYDEEKAKINNVYDNAVKLTKDKEYEKALKLVKNGISLARKQNVYTGKFNALKKEITSYIDKLEQAKEKYDIAMKFYNKKDYSNVILNLENIISLVPDEDLYIKRLAEIKQEWDNKQAQAENLYIEAKNYFQNNDLNNAKSSVNKALRLIKDSRYITLKKDIEREQENIVKEQEAEKLYKEAEKLYGTKNINYEHIIELLNSAISKYPKATYQDLLKKVKSERDTVEAENLYKKAKKDFENKDYDSAISSISEAIKLIPSNRMYIDLKQKISWEQQEYETNQKAEQSYKAGLKAYNNGDFATAVDNLTKACNMKPDNEEWKNLLEKVKSGKIDIMCCTKRGLLTLEFIDNEKAEQIINARNDGDKWYNYEEFAQAFEIMPHLYPDIEEKISFPLKQGNQYGRRVES